MFNRNTSGRGFRHGLILAGMVAGATLTLSAAAIAGECPADKFKPDVRQPVSHAGKGVTDTQQLEKVVRRAIGSWVGGKIRRRPMIIPVVIEA